MSIPEDIRQNSIDRPACDKELAAIVRAEETAKINQEMSQISSMTDYSAYRSSFDQEKADKFILLIGHGLSVHAAAGSAGINPPSTIYWWIVQVPEFSQRYLEACQAKCMKWADQLVSLADECPADIPSVAKCRQQIDVRKWMLSKIVPKVFGEKLQVNHDVKGSPQVNIILPGKGGKTPDLPPAPPDATATIPPPALVIEMDNQNDVPSANQVPEKKYKKSRKTKPD